jgi:hypothetical protein
MRPQAWLAALTLAALCLPVSARAQAAPEPLSDVPRRATAPVGQRALSQLSPAEQAASEAAADDWVPGMPVPPGYRIEHPVQLGFIIPGAATFSILYLVSVALADDGDSPVMAAPLVGPLFALNQEHPRNKYGAPALLVLGLGQVVGVGLVAMGFIHRRTTLDSIDPDDLEDGFAARLSVGPLWAERAQGLAVAGRF